MRLRTRLALTVVAAALPLAIATVLLRIDLERRGVEQVLREFAVTRMDAGGREACEADPASFPRARGGPPRRPGGLPGPPPGDDPAGAGGELRPPPDLERPPEGPRGGRGRRQPPPPPRADESRQFWAYDAELTSANIEAPPVDGALAAAISDGRDVAGRSYTLGERSVHEALVRMSWNTGPCAFVLVRQEEPRRPGAEFEPWLAGLLVGGGVLVAVFLAAGPVVRRIRRLEDDVRAAAGDTYARPVAVSGDDEIAALATAFNDAASLVRARVADVLAREETLRRFVANTTHDVMTPLTVLQGHLTTLRDAVSGGDDATRDAARDALREVDYTTSLLANLSAAAKLEAGDASFILHAVDLNELIERVATRFGPVAAAQEVELNHAVPADSITVEGDVTLLEQAVGNVVQNAVRYNRSGGHVALVLRAEPDDRFSVRVVDDGPGVPAEQLEALTGRGTRGDAARSRAPNGHGIGLDIVRGVCARHGIELSFSTSASGGLEVAFSGRRVTGS